MQTVIHGMKRFGPDTLRHADSGCLILCQEMSEKLSPSTDVWINSCRIDLHARLMRPPFWDFRWHKYYLHLTVDENGKGCWKWSSRKRANPHPFYPVLTNLAAAFLQANGYGRTDKPIPVWIRLEIVSKY